MKIYISGAITDDLNYEEKFERAERFLLEQGHSVVNPAAVAYGEEFSYKDFIDMDLNALMRCDAIYMLNGWGKSKGARLELLYAVTVGLDVYYQEGEESESSYSV